MFENCVPFYQFSFEVQKYLAVQDILSCMKALNGCNFAINELGQDFGSANLCSKFYKIDLCFATARVTHTDDRQTNSIIPK